MVQTRKEELETQIHNVKSYYRIGLAASILFIHKVAPNILRESHVQIGDWKETFLNLANYLEDPHEKQTIVTQVENIFRRFAIREPYELIFEYCKKSSQLDKLRKKEWFDFARLSRNALAHNFRWHFKEEDEKVLPVTYWEKTISKELEGQIVSGAIITPVIVWNLNTDFLRFVRDELEDYEN